MTTTTTKKAADKPTKNVVKDLAIQLGVLQRRAKDLGIPVLVVIEGLDASNKGQLLNQVLLEIDSRSFKVYSTHASHEEPRNYPLLHRFWVHTPAKGQIQFYDRSAYYLVLDAWAEGKLHEEELPRYWDEISVFERQLNDSGVQIVKIFLTVSKKEQAKRFEKLENNPKTNWRVTPKDWRRHRQYRSYLSAAKRMIERTDRPYSKWHIIDTDDFKEALVNVYHRIIEKLQIAVDSAAKKPKTPPPSPWIPYIGQNFLKATSFPEPFERDRYKKLLKARQETIHELAHEVHSHQIPVVVVFCGWDAAGKGGCIKRLVQSIDPRGYDVVPIAAPTKIELNHHYLWRFWKEMPPRGKITIFDRSWYGRVLVERVEGLCANREWQAAYQEINEMEEHLTLYGTSITKFWLHIDKDTQLERFEARQNNPIKQWKITDEDWRNREKWDKYEESVNEMIEKTNTPYAPWNIVPANCKMRARIKTLDVVIETISKALKKRSKPVL